MTREQARKELEGTWMFKMVDGQIALRDVALIEAVQAHQNKHEIEQGELVPQTPALPTWPSL